MGGAVVEACLYCGGGESMYSKTTFNAIGYCLVEESFLDGKSIFTLEGDCGESLPILKISL